MYIAAIFQHALLTCLTNKDQNPPITYQCLFHVTSMETGHKLMVMAHGHASGQCLVDFNPCLFSMSKDDLQRWMPKDDHHALTLKGAIITIQWIA